MTSFSLPVSQRCVHNCSYCHLTGARRQDFKLALSQQIDLAKQLNYKSMLFPCNLIHKQSRQHWLDRTSDSGMESVVCLNILDLNQKNLNWICTNKKIHSLKIIFAQPDYRAWNLLASNADRLPDFRLTWIVDTKKHWKALIKKIPAQWFFRLDFYFPLNHRHIEDIARDMEKLKRLGIRVRPPLNWEIHNPEQDSVNRFGLPQRIWQQNRVQNPEVSVIILAHNRKACLQAIFGQWLEQDFKPSYEIIFVDDASDDGSEDTIKSVLQAKTLSCGFTYLRFDRDGPRQRGQSDFRAASLRNTAALYANGKYLSFADADILTGPNYLNEVCSTLAVHDLVMARRYDLHRIRVDYSNLDPNKNCHQTDSYWHSFYTRANDWDKLKDKWKYACTHSLSLSAETFLSFGGFRRSFCRYGFEDSEFAYRLAKAGKSFAVLNNPVYHLPDGESEFGKSHFRKLMLLKKSAPVFLVNSLDPEVFSHLRYLYTKPFYLRSGLSAAKHRLNFVIPSAYINIGSGDTSGEKPRKADYLISVGHFLNATAHRLFLSGNSLPYRRFRNLGHNTGQTDNKPGHS